MNRVRLRLHCQGAVQGVGFRPWVYRAATALGLAGWVLNGPDGLLVEVEGDPAAVETFTRRLREEPPPLARLDRVEIRELPAEGATGFAVRSSEDGQRRGALVPPDAALCPDCRREMEDPADRRHRYPFTGCASCGPRFSLVRSLPYDRCRTTMACFPLCPDCRREYTDPADRRFHTEPLCCPACGPRLWLADPGGRELASGRRALERAAGILEEGGILALKGLGGFQLACRADRPGPVAELRRRKRRPSKPLALMVPDADTARTLVELDGTCEALLASPRSPIVLAPGRPGSPVTPEVAPGMGDLGVMLPTTPLHVELFRAGAPPVLVMTSGNLSDEPIATGNREALARLGGLADAFLLHDRDIARRVDDSVVRSSPLGPVLVRRSRGWVPEPLPLPEPTPEPVLALGAHLQATACLAAGDQAWPSQHVGDLDTQPARSFLEEAAEGLESFLEVRARRLASDLHPDYASTWLAAELAERRGGRVHALQHHLAHAAATLAEHRAFPAPGERALAIALDGTGMGTDGTAWGGEWLLLDGNLRWRRLGGLEPLSLVGGEQAVRQPWRVALAALERAGAAELVPRLPLADLVAREVLPCVLTLGRRPDWPLASGAGRIFEACGALLGLVGENRWEGEAAAALEAAAARAGEVEPWPEVTPGDRRLPSAALLAAAARRLLGGTSVAEVARGFHATFSRLAVELTLSVIPPGVDTVALGGGVFVNRLVLGGIVRDLTAAGLRVLRPTALPPGDGGLAYGQAVLAGLELARGGRWVEAGG